MSERVTSVEIIEAGVALITIQRPEALNALNKQVFEELNSFFKDTYQEVDGLISVIITGSGDKAFVAGADIKELQSLTTNTASDYIDFGHKVMDQIEAFHVPVIAGVNGFALGGGLELAMACHLRYASPNAKFGLPELKLGLIPGYGGTQRLVRYIGRTKAMELMLTGNFIGSQDAEALGLINSTIQENLVEHCLSIAEKISNQGPIAISEAISTMNAFNQEAMSVEKDTFSNMITGMEAAEGLSAFIEKRKAKFER